MAAPIRIERPDPQAGARPHPLSDQRLGVRRVAGGIAANRLRHAGRPRHQDGGECRHQDCQKHLCDPLHGRTLAHHGGNVNQVPGAAAITVMDRPGRAAYVPDMTGDAQRDPSGWQPLKAPSLAEFEAIAAETFRTLPAHFRTRCEDVVIRVEEYATDEVLDTMQIASELDLMGLFQGIGLPFQSESTPAAMPNMVWLYRVPILLYWAEHDETLGAVISHVLIHEIGHHFGLSDDDIDAIERMADEPDQQGAREP